MKDRCRAILGAAGFRQPAVRLCAGIDDAIAFLGSSKGPWVIKPRDQTASIGVSKIQDVSELAQAMAELTDKSSFLVEEFVEGREYSAEGVFIGGMPTVLAVTAKEKLPPPHFVEIGHVLPAELEDAAREEIELTTGAALIALGLGFGVFHAELWLTDDGVVMGEVHPRPGGDWLHVLLSHAIPGLELFGLVFDDALGLPPACDLTPTRGAAARFLAPQQPGRLVRVEGWEAVLAHPAVLHAELNVDIGAELGPVCQSGDRAGVVVVGAERADLARQLAEELAASVRFITR
jgi:biotin carboxylase